MKNLLVYLLPFLQWTRCTSQNVCEEPPDIDFGEIRSGEKAAYVESDRVQYNCNPGFALQGSEWITCSGQKWTPPPKCLAPCIVTKQQLEAKDLLLSGNRVRTQLIQHNHVLQFHCREGHVLTMPMDRKCLDGHMDLPSCISERGKNCSRPPAIENGDIITLSKKQYKAGSSVQFKCQKYYALEGDNRTFCDNGTWTKAPVCLEPCAISLAEMENRKIEIKRRLDEVISENIYVPRGGSVEFTCKMGYMVTRNPSQSVSVIQCIGDSIVYPECKEIVCSPPQVENGNFQPNQIQYEYQDTIETQCEAGYQLQSHQSTSTCTETGWSPPPICIPKDCGYIRIENGKLSDAYERWPDYYFPRRVGQTLDYRCSSGFLPRNKDTWGRSSCTKLGWSPEPKCFKKCDIPRQFAHGTFNAHTWQKFIEGDEISFSCDNGYDPANQQAKAVCTKNGWSPAPRCDIKKTELME
ncbi:complement factor H-like [Podarcis raffonei]|uniref:complement factor H-like n=1 Tax=Podarcis raffonei TaxID=65483 RepID=UPI0023297CC7|nr:complement factor H-like [Podarcis raffonei]